MEKLVINSTNDLIHYLVESKKQILEEIKHSGNRPEVQEALEKLRARKLNNK